MTKESKTFAEVAKQLETDSQNPNKDGWIECGNCNKMTPEDVDDGEWWCIHCGWDGIGRPWVSR